MLIPRRASSIAALLFALGVTTAARADRALAGSAANPVPPGIGSTPIQGMAAAPLPPPKLPVLVNADLDVPFPANGSFLLDARGATTAASIWLEEVSATIDGSARMLDTFIVWTPSRALTPGTLYSLVVALPGGALREMYPVRATTAIEASRPAVRAMLRLERVDSMASPKCCASIPGFPVRSSACFSTETKSMVRMRGALSADAPPSALTQFMFRLKRAGDMNVAGTIGFTPLLGIQPLLWPEPEDEYCAELSALDIGSSRIFDYDDLEMRCPSKDELGDLSPRPVPLDAARVLSHTICSVPPRDFETEWCDTNRAVCSSSAATPGCENWDHLCEGGPAPVAGSGGKRPIGSTAGVGAAGATARPRASDTRDDPGFGCSVQQHGAGSWLAALSCAFAWLLLARRRRSTP